MTKNRSWLASWRPDLAKLAETLVLDAVLAIAALISYTHLRAVWVHAGAPWPDLGPGLVDGLFAAAWLRMRRRRREGVPVGVLAWLALVLALLATLAGNLAAAWISGHRDPLSMAVAAWPAVTLALVWELVTGHGGRPAGLVDSAAAKPQGDDAEVESVGDSASAQAELAPARQVPTEPPFAWDPDGAITAEARELWPVGRPTLVEKLPVKDWQAKELVKLLASETNGVARKP